MDARRYDVGGVGGAPVGLSAALVPGLAHRRLAVVDVGSARNAPASRTPGFLSPVEAAQRAHSTARADNEE